MTSLPPERAFVVRLGSDADPARGRLHGRVEHVQSGRTARIASLSELQEFLLRILVEEGGRTEEGASAMPAPNRSDEKT